MGVLHVISVVSASVWHSASTYWWNEVNGYICLWKLFANVLYL